MNPKSSPQSLFSSLCLFILWIYEELPKTQFPSKGVLGRRGDLSFPLQFVLGQENVGAGPVQTVSSFLEVSALIKWVSLAHTLGFWSIFQRLSSFYGNSYSHNPEAFNVGCCSVRDKLCRSLVSKYSRPLSHPPLIPCRSAFFFLTNNSGEEMGFFLFCLLGFFPLRAKRNRRVR